MYVCCECKISKKGENRQVRVAGLLKLKCQVWFCG